MRGTLLVEPPVGFEPTAFLHLGAGALTEACTYATAYGMTDQVDTINQAFSPSDHEIAEAHKMLDVPIDGPHDGSYLPRYLRAKKVKELAKVYGLWGKTESDAQRANV